MNISYDKLMYDPEHGNLRTLSRGGKLIIPMPQEINNLPNVKLGPKISETETVMTQKFYVQHNEEDYEGVRVVLSTDLDTIMYDALKNETGEYQYDFPILAENVTIKYYIYSYKGDLKGNYTEKHVYKKNSNILPKNTFRFQWLRPLETDQIDTEKYTVTKVDDITYDFTLRDSNSSKFAFCAVDLKDEFDDDDYYYDENSPFLGTIPDDVDIDPEEFVPERSIIIKL